MSTISALLLLVTAISALVAGYSLMTDPSGNGLHMNPSHLRYSPFTNYFIPGLILFTVNGLLNCIAVLFIIFRQKQYALAIIFQGCLLLGWIVIQAYLLRELNFLHILFAGIAILLILLGTRIWYLTKVRL